MTYQEVINHIKSLGFSDDEEIEEFAESGVLNDSINRAITRINLEVSPIIERYEFEIDDADEGYLYISMPDIDDHFLDFAETPVLIEKSGSEFYTKFANYDIEAEDTLVINADENKGSFRVFYKKQHETFEGTEVQIDTPLPLPLKVHHLVPLLAGYYVWLEDDPTKAAQCFNMYEKEQSDANERDKEKKIKIRVLPGGM